MRIISVVKDGRRVDIPQDKFQKVLADVGLNKGGAGSGRYPAGSGGKDKIVTLPGTTEKEKRTPYI